MSVSISILLLVLTLSNQPTRCSTTTTGNERDVPTGNNENGVQHLTVSIPSVSYPSIKRTFSTRTMIPSAGMAYVSSTYGVIHGKQTKLSIASSSLFDTIYFSYAIRLLSINRRMKSISSLPGMMEYAGLALDALYSVHLDTVPLHWTFSCKKGSALSSSAQLNLATYFLLSLMSHASKLLVTLSLNHLSEMVQICFDIARTNQLIYEVTTIIINTFKEIYSIHLDAVDFPPAISHSFDYQVVNLVFMEVKMQGLMNVFWKNLWNTLVEITTKERPTLLSSLYQRKLSVFYQNTSILSNTELFSTIFGTFELLKNEFGPSVTSHFSPYPLTLVHIKNQIKLISLISDFIHSSNGRSASIRKKVYECVMEIQLIFVEQCYFFAYCLFRYCQDNPILSQTVIEKNQEHLQAFSLSNQMTLLLQELNFDHQPTEFTTKLDIIQSVLSQNSSTIDFARMKRLLSEVMFCFEHIYDKKLISLFHLNEIEHFIYNLGQSSLCQSICGLIEKYDHLFKYPICSAFFVHNFINLPERDQKTFLELFYEYLHLSFYAY